MKQDDLNEMLPVVDQDGNVIGSATRKECHNGSMKLHPVVHLHVYNGQGGLYLQKRPNWKDIQPGKWETSVSGHIAMGEKPDDALRREAMEELNISGFEPVFVMKYVYENSAREREFIYVYGTIYHGTITPSEEVEEGRFWNIEQIDEDIKKHDDFSLNYRSELTPNFRHEFNKLRSMIDFKSDLLLLAHHLFKTHQLLNENNSEDIGIQYEDISREYDAKLKERYGEPMEWLWIKGGVYNSKRKENTKRVYNRRMIEAVNDIKSYLASIGNPIRETHTHESKNPDKKINTDVHYKYPPGINYDIMDRWVEEQVKNYRKGLQKKGLLRLLAKSEGLIPVSWLADDISNQTDNNQRKLISFDSNLNLWNLGMIPNFFRAIEGQKVLEILYKKGYMEEETIIFHPWFLKEYNHRWICFGKKEGNDGEYQVGLERVVDMKNADHVAYIKPEIDFSHYFDDIVGLRHPKKDGVLIPIQHIEIEILQFNAYNRITTKPIHQSQKFIEHWKGDNRQGSAKISIDVRPNNELVGLLLSFGSQIRVLPTASKWLENEIYYNAKRIMDLYPDKNKE